LLNAPAQRSTRKIYLWQLDELLPLPGNAELSCPNFPRVASVFFHHRDPKRWEKLNFFFSRSFEHTFRANRRNFRCARFFFVAQISNWVPLAAFFIRPTISPNQLTRRARNRPPSERRPCRMKPCFFSAAKPAPGKRYRFFPAQPPSSVRLAAEVAFAHWATKKRDRILEICSTRDDRPSEIVPLGKGRPSAAPLIDLV